MPVLRQKLPLFCCSEPLISAMSDGGPSKQAADSQGTPKKPPDGPDPEPKEDTESAEAARTLHNTLLMDYSMYVQAWREPVERKLIKIDKEKKYGQIRKINWDDVAQKAQFNLTSQPSGPSSAPSGKTPKEIFGASLGSIPSSRSNTASTSGRKKAWYCRNGTTLSTPTFCVITRPS